MISNNHLSDTLLLLERTGKQVRKTMEIFGGHDTSQPGIIIVPTSSLRPG